MVKRTQPNEPKKPNPTELGQMLINIYESGYLDRAQAYKTSFIKGVISGLGGAIGATIIFALLLWILSLFGNVPLAGRFVHNIQQSSNNQRH